MERIGTMRSLEWMRKTFPDILVEDKLHVVEDGSVLTSAGISAGIDMALRVVTRDHGERFQTEDDILKRPESNSQLQEIVDSIRSLEEQLLIAHEQGLIETTIMRYGLLYGAASESTRYMLRLIKRRLLPMVSDTQGLSSWIHLDDAVSATVAAIEAAHPERIYNIVDDHPSSLNDWIAHASCALGAKSVLHSALVASFVYAVYR